MRKAWSARLKDASATAVATALALGLSAPPRANAADGHDPADAAIAGGSACPAPPAVWAELETLVPSERLTDALAALTAQAGPPTIVDQGAVYRVVAAGNAREYRDDARDCAQRARVAAIFLALTLEPAEAPALAPTPPAPAAAPSVAEARVRLDVGARFDVGRGPSPPDLAGGPSLRLGLGGGALLVAVGAAFLLPRRITVGGVRLQEWRVPLDLALRVRRRGPTFAPYGEAGVVIALLSERATELAAPQTAHAVELGLRAAVGVRGAWSSRLALFAALHAELIPLPPAIVALPQGAVGHTPNLWLGATAGLSWGLP